MAMLEILISDPQAMIQMDKYLSCSSITVLFKYPKGQHCLLTQFTV